MSSSSTQTPGNPQVSVSSTPRGPAPQGFNYNENGILVPTIVMPTAPRKRCSGCKCGDQMGKTCGRNK